MRTNKLGAVILAGCLAAFPAAYGRKNDPPAPRRFSKQIGKQDRIRHALSRLTFGSRPGDDERVRSLGLKKWLDRQLHPERIPETPELTARLQVLDSLAMTSADLVRNYPAPQIIRQMAAGQLQFPSDPARRKLFERLAERAELRQAGGPAPAAGQLAEINALLTPAQLRSLRAGSPQQRLAAFQALPAQTQDEALYVLPPGIRQPLVQVAPPELRRKLQMLNGPQQVVATDLAEGKLLRAIYSNRQLEEVLADFWYNHFNVYLDKGADRYLVTEYEREVIRPHVLGRFRELLEATAKSPAMLFYLDNWQSAGQAPPARPGANAAHRGLNENYGRELLELHTLGVDGGYTQKDVTEVARCFTGWTINQPQRGGSFTFNPRIHDLGEKTVLGVTIPAGGGMEDGEKVLDILAVHPSTARFISTKLAQRFVADAPPPALVNKMAQTFVKTGGDIRAVLKTMLDAKEFWSEGAYRSKMKSPLEMVASAVRAVNGNVDSAMALANQLQQLGQPLYRKVEPTGYSNVSAEWLNSAGLLARMNFALQLANNRMPGVRVDSSGQAPGALAAMLGSPDFQKR